MPTVLSVHDGVLSRDYPLEAELTLGRAADNAVLLDSDAVSRHHAVVAVAAGVVTFTDLGSANGSRVDGIDVAPRVPLPIGLADEVSIGPYLIRLKAAQSGSPPPPMLQSPVQSSPRVAPQPFIAGATGSAGTQIAPPPAAHIEVTINGDGREFALAGETISVGRAAGNDIVIDSNFVSRNHFLLRRSEGSFLAVDLGTTNGLRINGEAVTSKLLADGDIIDPGHGVVIVFRMAGAAGTSTIASSGRPLSLNDNRELTIGRDPASGIHLAHPMVSLQHAKLGLFDRGTGGWVEDLGSTNGTFVNGVRTVAHQRTPLRAGDTVQVGPIRMPIFGSATGNQAGFRDQSKEIGLTAVGLNQRVRPDLNLLQNLSFVIKKQEFVAVVGVSGAGKSTLLGALSGFRPASEGEVLLDGVSLYENFDAFRTSMGYVPQDDILHKELPVRNALNYAAELRLPDDTTRAERERRVAAVIHEMALEDRATTTVGQLSGGQRKRVSIGAELLTEPGLFYLDEATSGLDPGTESQLMKLLRRLADEGHTVVLITHATKNVMLCDQVIFLAKGGYLAYYGPPDQALTYFEVADFDGIYEKLEGESTPAEWGARYTRSTQYQTYVDGRLREEGIQPGAPPRKQGGLRPFAGTPPPAPTGTSALRQLGVLSRRYLDITRRDRVNVALLLALAPILGSMDLILWKRAALSRQDGDTTRTMTMLFLAALIPFLVGSLSFVREIVKEVPIYARERAVSLQIWPYLASKVVVALPIVLYHAAVLTVIKLVVIEFPGMTPVDVFIFYVTIVLSGISGVMWALLISTLTRKEEQAMMLVIGLVIMQIVFSGGLVSLSTLGPAGTVLGDVTSTSWAFKALAASAEISTDGCSGEFTNCNLPAVSGQATIQERALTYKNIDKAFGDIFDGDVLICWGAMITIIVALAIVLGVLQKRKDLL